MRRALRWLAGLALSASVAVACSGGDTETPEPGGGSQAGEGAGGDSGTAGGAVEPIAGHAGTPAVAGSGGAPVEPAGGQGGAPVTPGGGVGGVDTAEGGAGGSPVACVPKTKATACGFEIKCGKVDNGCEGTVNCGSCSSVQICDSGECVCAVRPVTAATGGCVGYCEREAPIGCGGYYPDYPEACGPMLTRRGAVCSTFWCTDDVAQKTWTCGPP